MAEKTFKTLDDEQIEDMMKKHDCKFLPGFVGFDCDSFFFDMDGERYHIRARIRNNSDNKREYELVPYIEISKLM